MQGKLKYIAELEKLNSLKEITHLEGQILETEFKFDAIGHFLRSMFHAVKPETASGELMRAIVTDILRKEAFAEHPVTDGFIDFAIQENVVNPILLELKPAYSFNEKKECIEQKELKFIHHKNQIQKYLKSNDYIILTDLNKAFLFNREAILEYKPFHEISFTELLKGFLQYDSLWDTIRRLEDNLVKVDLEKEFFQNLKKWYAEFHVIEFDQPNGLEKEELIVLLMNKVIFIKTLEDYGLIPYKFLEDNYFEKRNRWETKGYERVFTVFFNELEDWFWEFYDTELFRTKIWSYVKKDKNNIERFKKVFERTLGLDNWDYTFGKGMIHYNYRLIDEDVFGKAYETFIAEDKKDSGIYYTPKPITQYMAQRLVKLLFDEKINEIIHLVKEGDCNKALTLLDEVQKIKIVDTCSGSGSFLIKVLREVFNYYQLLDEKTAWVNKLEVKDMFDAPENVQCAKEFREHVFFTDYRKLIASVVLNHICAIDIDERALETAKTNIWKEAVKLKPEIFSYRKLPPEINHILPNLELNFINADSIFDLELQRQIDHITTHFKTQIVELHAIRKQYIENPYDPDILESIRGIKKVVRKALTELLPPLGKPTLIALEFFYLYFDEEGKPLPENKCGFGGVISNPPWEEIYPVKKEFAGAGKYELDKKDFDKEFEKRLKKDDVFKMEWQQYEKFYAEYSAYVSSEYQYHIMKPGSSTAKRSHLNYFKLLFERNLQIMQKGGYMSILIPSSFQTDEGAYGLRKLAMIDNTLFELFSFENRGYTVNIDGIDKTIKPFPDVDNRFKFSVVLVKKETDEKNKNKQTFESLFYLLDPKDLTERKRLEYNIDLIERFSPENLSIMEFRSEKDYQLCAKIIDKHQLLGNMGLDIRREFNVSDDSGMFAKEKNKNHNTIVYEGKMIHQFNPKYADEIYYANDEAAREDLINKETYRIKVDLELKSTVKETRAYFEKKKYLLDYETYRLGYRAVGSSTNERTLISTILPPNTFSVNSINYLINCYYQATSNKEFKQVLNSSEEVVYIMSLFNSLTLNYYIRNKISANLNMFYLYEMPIPDASKKQKSQVVEMGFNLLYHNSDTKLYDDLAKELKIKPEKKFDSIQTRAELEVLIAKELFGLSKEDWKYLTATFTYGDDSTTKKELDKIIEKSIEIF